MKTGVVIPVGPGREANLVACLQSLENQEVQPEVIIMVHDGPEAYAGEVNGLTITFSQVKIDKHKPGDEQPRNVGVRVLEGWNVAAEDAGDEPITHAWFVDSDIIYRPDALAKFIEGHGDAPEDRILVGPYDWLSEGEREPSEDLHNDPRWPSFNDYDPCDVRREDIGAGLACFSGNLIWPIEEFKKVGGFWNELHHGRCEDGELGLRATALGIPISFVREARGWHLAHPVNLAWAREANTRDVPMLNARHPWVQGEGLHVVPEDGRRFNAMCPTCNQSINTIDWWNHRESCGGAAV